MKPVLQAILLADHVYNDQPTGKKIVAGIFHVIHFKKLASNNTIANDTAERKKTEVVFSSGSPFLYISLTEIHGPMKMEINFVNLLDNSILMTNKLDFAPPLQVNPVTTVEFVVPLPILQIPHTGDYAIELQCDGELVGSHRIQAVEITEGAQ